MGWNRSEANRSPTCAFALVVAGLLLLVFLRPVDAVSPIAQATVAATSYVHVPYVARNVAPTPVTTPTSTPIPQVDLRIWDIVIAPSQPAPGQQFDITVTAKNLGPDDAVVGTHIWLDVGAFHFEGDVASPLAADDTASMVRTMSFSWPGSYSASGWVDPYDFVPETNEDNNVTHQPFLVQ